MKIMKMLVSYMYCNQGGVTSVIKQRIPVLSQNNWVVDAVFSEDNGGKTDLLNHGVNKVEIFTFNFSKNVKDLIKKENYDLHVIIDTPSLISLKTEFPRMKTIFEIHSSIIPTISKYLPNQLASMDKIIVPSSWLKETVQNLFPKLDSENVLVIPNIVNTNYFSPNGDSYDLPPTMLWVGKFTEFKNWQEAIEIGKQFLSANPGWNFVMITGGQPKEKDVVETLSKFITNDLINRFRWLHNVNHEDMGNLYRGAAKTGGFLLSTSKAESFCLVVHEAMRCGLPVVSSNVGPLPEIVEDGVSGFLYELGDIKTAIEKSNLYLNQEIREDIVAEGFKKLIKFDQSAIEEEYTIAINEVLEKN